MKLRRTRHLFAHQYLAGVIGVGVLLAGCGTSDPPLDELLREVVDSANVDEATAQCMDEVIDTFELTSDERAIFSDLEDAASQLADADPDAPSDNFAAAQAIVDRFEDQLVACVN